MKREIQNQLIPKIPIQSHPYSSLSPDRLLNIIEAIRREIDVPFMALSVTIQGRLDTAERRFWEFLVEDAGSGLNWSYSEFEARLKAHGGAIMR